MIAPGPPFRLLPRLDPSNEFFWTSGRTAGCDSCAAPHCATYVHPPSPVCPDCLGDDLAPAVVSGRGTVESFTLNVQQWIPGSEPYLVAWVSIAEQPDVRLTTNLVEVEPDDVTIGMAVTVVFEEHDDVFLPLFAPRGPA